jgi:hypothetical protein
MSSEVWTAVGTFGTWALVVITFFIARWARRDAREQLDVMRQAAQEEVAAVRQAANDQTSVLQAHVDTLREDLRARLLLHYETRWDSADMISQRKHLASLLLPSVATNVPPYPTDEIPDAVPNFFETIGILCKREQLEAEMVWHIFGYYARRYGQMLGPFFLHDREVHGDSSLWTGFLGLVETLRAMDQQVAKGVPHSFSGDELKLFFREETQLQ